MSLLLCCVLLGRIMASCKLQHLANHISLLRRTAGPAPSVYLPRTPIDDTSERTFRPAGRPWVLKARLPRCSCASSSPSCARFSACRLPHAAAHSWHPDEAGSCQDKALRWERRPAAAAAAAVVVVKVEILGQGRGWSWLRCVRFVTPACCGLLSAPGSAVVV